MDRAFKYNVFANNNTEMVGLVLSNLVPSFDSDFSDL